MALTPEELKLRISAINDTKKAFKQFNDDLVKASNNTKKTAKDVKATGIAMSGMGRNAGQAGIQIQQLVGQIQGGTNPMLALSQQAADLGFVLGAPLVGAVAGLAASFAMVLLPSLFDTAGGIKKVRGLMEELNDDITDLTAAQLAERTRLIDEDIANARRLVEELEKSKTDEIAGFQFTVPENELQTIQAQIDTYLQKIEQLEKSKKFLNGTTADEISNIERLIKSTQEQAETLGMTNTQLLIYRARQMGASDADIERLQTLGMTIEEYDRQLEKEKEIAAWKQQYDAERKKANENMLREQERITEETLRQLKPIEDSFVNLINGSKSVSDSFKAMAKSIIDDLIRIEVQRSITGPLSNLIGGMGGFGGVFSSMFGTPTTAATAAPQYMDFNFGGATRALGGQVSAGQAYTVGEHGREMFVPSTNGQIVSNDNLGGGVTIVQNINVSTGVQQTVRAEIANLLPKISDAAKSAVADARQRGGGFSKAMGV